MNSDTKESEALKFPKGVLFIIQFQCFSKFAYNGLRGILPLYLVDVLHFEESEATVFYHSFSVCIFFFSMTGGILADSLFGRFKSILYFSIFFVLGLLLVSTSAVPPLNLPIRELTILGLIIVAFGYGAARPCVPAFSGDQFVLPQQAKQLSLLFVFLCIAQNIGSVSAYFVIPVLRKDLTCFGELTCYSLAFLVPAVLIALSSVIVLCSRRLYRIQKLESNIVVQVIKCISYALYQKIKSKDKRHHWLDLADDKYDPKLIEDIKSTSQLIKLFLPMPIFWSLFSMQSTTWMYQASRMNGELAGYVIKPDQISATNPLFVIIFIPLFHSYIFPFLEKFFFLNTPLRKITVGGFLTAVSFLISAALEFNLETTYAITPTKGLAQLRVFNTLNCKVPMMIDEQKFILTELNMWQNVSIPARGKIIFKYEADFSDCKIYGLTSKISGNVEVKENQATSWTISKNLNYKFIDKADKSVSGNPLVRALIYIDDDFSESHTDLNIRRNGETLEKIRLTKDFKVSEFKEVTHNTYDLYLNDHLVEKNVALKLGGVYTVLGYLSKSNATAVRTVTVTEPNSIHIFWILPQQIVMSICEILVDVKMMEFAFSQAPLSMKALLQSFWLLTAFFGNIIIIVITEAHFFERKVFELILYAILMIIGIIIFAILATFYTYKQISDHKSHNKDVFAEEQ